MGKSFTTLVAVAAITSLFVSSYALIKVNKADKQARLEVQVMEYEVILQHMKSAGVFDSMNQTKEGRYLKASIIETAENCVGQGYSIDSGQIGVCIASLKMSKLIK
ncbi:hypothetical protein [Vibrio anguillarum]|uniref:Uncharacterized protein n=1 Tax=Vibrio anguillarum TaxID=55601 RepID=A0A7U6J3L7_VIBAN|nr:hypothetical protein [Vibrio anguillarum]AZS26253.1 hypothetical protein DYL72_15200 [Vibrio anguillarum]MBF4374534.1 hypothetical protein [Vibrio anguillarum]MBF4438389.1 hypothetical protein [Vibrio anguillarum]